MSSLASPESTPRRTEPGRTDPGRTDPGRSGPDRTGPGPFIVLGLVALLPALALFALASWSRDRIPDADAAPAVVSPIVDPPLPDDPLVNGVMSFRRMPTIISRDTNVERFVDVVTPFLGSLNDRSCVAISVDGVPVGDRNGDLAVIPASNQKLIVAAVALEMLGEDHTFLTQVVSADQPVDGSVDGDLVLLGGGDPLLTSDWYPTSSIETRPVFNSTSLDELADRVEAAGVTRINGAVLGDGSRYDDEFSAPGWGNGVAGLEAGPYDALMANDSRVFGEDSKSDDPSAGAAREFTRLLRDRGIEVVGDPATGDVSALGEVPNELASVDSAPLGDVVAEMLTNSDNNTAEMLVKEIGLEQASDGTRQAGIDAMTAQLESWDIDTTNVALADGSGLSLDNRLTCDALVGVLRRFEAGGPLGSGMPVAGETGALVDVFGNGPVAGRLLGKTGTLNNPPFNQDPPAVKALSGYLPVDGGGAVEYSLILNGPTISDQSEYRPVWDALVGVLAEYPAGPSPADLGLL